MPTLAFKRPKTVFNFIKWTSVGRTIEIGRTRLFVIATVGSNLPEKFYNYV